MPVKKMISDNETVTSKAKAVKPRSVKTSSKEDGLMDFDQFVARTPQRKSGGKTWIFITLVVVILVLLAAVLFLPKTGLQKDSKYKTVFLDNGQVYFAKVVKEDRLNIYLDDVYYIQTEQQVVPATVEGAEDQTVEVPMLVKRGQELHQPSGWMQVNREKVVSIEEIGPDSEVLKEIERQKAL